jgi:hypothetical protein
LTLISKSGIIPRIMAELEPRRSLGRNSLSPLVRIAERTGEISKLAELDSSEQESLRRYAHLVYRAREISKSFNGTTTPKVTYTFDSDEKGKPQEINVTRDNYFNWINILAKLILGIQSTYLDTNASAREARREILTFVRDLTPQDA